MSLIEDKLVMEADDNNFEEILSNTNLPILVDFWSPTCAPCRMQSPIIEQVAHHYEDKVIFVKVDISKARQVAQSMKIRSIPTIVIFKNMNVADVRIGLANQSVLIRMLDRALGKTLWQRWFGKKKK